MHDRIYYQNGLSASFNSDVNPEMKLFPLIIDVVATKYSVLLSSSCDKNLSAEISAYVQPPMKSTKVFLVPVAESCPDVLISRSSFLEYV